MGDIVHAKTDISPEQVSLVSYFLRGCADLCKTILIPGNHDFNVSNRSRMDALTPIVESLKHPNLWYDRESFALGVDDVTFSHLSIWGDQSDWKTADKIPGSTKIAMYHGPVVGARTELGFDRFPNAIPVSTFDGFDIVLLGDIHKRQFLDRNRTIAYPGSLIQQDHGEALHHGMLVWDVEQRTAVYREILNRYGYYTFYVKDDRVENYGVLLPEHVNVRIIHENTHRDVIKSIVDDLGDIVDDIQIISNKKSKLTTQIQNTDDILKSRDTAKQLELIRRYCVERHIDLSEQDVSKLMLINNDFNNQISSDDEVIRDVRWKPISFEFSNMFSYGPDNVVDFTTASGIIGIFAPNASGKSSLLDAITYCIFDKCSRTYKAVNVMNNQCDMFKCKFVFSIGDHVYQITREGKRKSDGTVSVDVDFILCSDGDRILNGKRRDDTNRIIRSYIGSYDDFVLTTMSSQVDNKSFIEMTQKDRQEMLYRFLDLSVYSDLYKVSKEFTKEMSAHIKRLEANNYVSRISETQSKIAECAEQLSNIDKIIADGETQIRVLNDRVVELSKQIPSVLKDLDIDSLLTKKSNTESAICELQIQLDSVNIEITRSDKLSVEYMGLLDGTDIRVDREMMSDISRDISTAIEQIAAADHIREEIEHLRVKANMLAGHEYDPNCQYCIRNKFVVDAQDAERRIPELQGKLAIIESTTESLDELRSKFEYYAKRVSAFDSLQYEYNKLLDTIATRSRERDRIISDINNARDLDERLTSDIDLYYAQRDMIDSSRDVAQQIKVVETQRTLIEMDVAGNKSARDLIVGNMVRFEYQLEELVKSQSDLITYYDEYRIYEIYQNAVNRDGIPYMILGSVLPVIESEVNNVLATIVDFRFKLTIGDNDSIDAFIQYDDVSWPVEMVSGMERFVLSLAIRSSLIRLSILPKPNFMAIDEGFGVLDMDKIQSLQVLFNHLRDEFGFVLCISHIMSMRDMVDSLVFIDKIDGFSKVRYL